MQIENNRPSAQEQAVADDKKRQPQNNNKSNVSQARIGQQAGRSYQTKESKSAFDNVLDNLVQESLMSKSEESPSVFENKFKEKIQDKERPKEKSDSKKDKDSDAKTSRSESAEASKGVKDLSSRQQVNAKQGFGEGGGGGGNSGGGGQQKGQGGKSFASQTRVEFRSDSVLAPGSAAAMRVDAFSNIEKTQKTASSSQIPKQMLDQIIQVIKVGMNKEDQKEIHLDLSAKVFRGLSLKLTSKNGKVEVAFITTDPNVRRLFDSEKQNISDALQEKGLQVSQIQVKFVA